MPCDDPVYDSIRHQPWFWRLEKRREKLWQLKQAKSHLDNVKDSRCAVAKEWQVDERELRDYISFVNKVKRNITATEQKILDRAYQSYMEAGGNVSFRDCIYSESKMWGINPRHVNELWETDYHFYPHEYKIN